jgi:hypothetical protein
MQIGCMIIGEGVRHWINGDGGGYLWYRLVSHFLPLIRDECVRNIVGGLHFGLNLTLSSA